MIECIANYLDPYRPADYTGALNHMAGLESNHFPLPQGRPRLALKHVMDLCQAPSS